MAHPSPHVVDVAEATFEAEVAQRSMQVPVVVDFWAPWCGPCKTLGPILEGLADEYGGAFVLAKINVDENPGLASYFRAQSIPMVVAIYQGRMLDQFMGALPRQQLLVWLEGVFKAAGLDATPAGPPQAPADPAEAEQFWRAQLATNAADDRARLGLGKLLFTSGAIEEAEALLKAIPPAADQYNAAQAALKLKGLLAEVGAAGGEAAVRARAEAQPDDVDAAYLVALADGASGRYAEALTVLVGQVQTGDKEQRDRAKANASVLLEAAGRDDAEVEAQRRRLARLLF